MDTSSQIRYETGQDVWAESPYDFSEHSATVVRATTSEVAVLWAHTGERETVDIAKVRPMFAFEGWKRTAVPTYVSQSTKFRKVQVSPDRQDTNEDIVKLRAALKSASTKAEKQQAEIKKLKWKYQFQTDEILDLEDELAERKKAIALQSNKLDVMNIKNEEISNQVLEMKRKHKDQTAKIKKIHKDQMSKAKKNHKDEMKQANGKMTEQEAEIIKLKGDVARANDKIMTEGAKMNAKLDEKAELKDKCEDQKDQIAMLEYQVEEQRAEIDELIESAKKANEKVAERHGEISELKTSLEELRGKVKGIIVALDEETSLSRKDGEVGSLLHNKQAQCIEMLEVKNKALAKLTCKLIGEEFSSMSNQEKASILSTANGELNGERDRLLFVVTSQERRIEALESKRQLETRQNTLPHSPPQRATYQLGLPPSGPSAWSTDRLAAVPPVIVALDEHQKKAGAGSIKYMGFCCEKCGSEIAVGHNGQSAFIKSLGPRSSGSLPGSICAHEVLPYLHPSVRGVPPWFKIRVEAKMHEKSIDCTLNLSFASDVWPPLSDELKRERHPILNQSDDFNELKKRALAYFQNTKKAKARRSAKSPE